MTDQNPVAAAPTMAPTALPSLPRPLTAVTPRSTSLALLQRFAVRVAGEWLPLIAWHASRTGRPGLIGMALLLASAVFAFSTQTQVTTEVATLRGELVRARARAVSQPHTAVSDAARALAHLPARADMPALLAVLIKQADAAQLSLDIGKYEMSSSKSGDITRYKITLPVAGPYPQIRRFMDATLTALPAASISDLRIQRKTVSDPNVEAQIRLTFYTRATLPFALPHAPVLMPRLAPRRLALWPAPRVLAPPCAGGWYLAHRRGGAEPRASRRSLARTQAVAAAAPAASLTAPLPRRRQQPHCVADATSPARCSPTPLCRAARRPRRR